MNNEQKLRAAFAIVLADDEFMNDNPKVNKLLEALTIKNGVTKQLNQAYTYGERDWALAFANGTSTRGQKNQHIKDHIMKTDAFRRFTTVPSTGSDGVIAKAEKAKNDAMAWIAEKFPEPDSSVEEASSTADPEQIAV